jgi:hypothetical protein
MNILVFSFIAVAGIAAALAGLAIWAPRRLAVRAIAVLTTALLLPVAYLQFAELLSRPKPMTFEWYERTTARADLISVSLHEGKAIYLWLRLEGSDVPRSYVVPWNLKIAEQLEDAVDEAIRRGSTIVLKKPFFRKSLEEWGDLNVEIIPPPTPPLKRPPPPPRLYNPRKQNI